MYVTVDSVVEHPLHSAATGSLHPLSHHVDADGVSCGQLPQSVKAKWSSYTLVAVLSRGNGELVAGPLLLGATRCSPVEVPATDAHSQWDAEGVTPLTYGLVEGHSGGSRPLGWPASDVRPATGATASVTTGRSGRQHPRPAVAGCTWLGSWRRMVRIGLPEETMPVPSYVGKSHLHLLFYFLSQPVGVGGASASKEAGKPVVVGFSYLVLHPDSPDVLIANGSHALKVANPTDTHAVMQNDDVLWTSGTLGAVRCVMGTLRHFLHLA